MLQHILIIQRSHRKIKGHSFYLLCASSGYVNHSRELNPDTATLSTEANQDMRGEKAVEQRFNSCAECACSEFLISSAMLRFLNLPFQLIGYGSILEYPTPPIPSEMCI